MSEHQRDSRLTVALGQWAAGPDPQENLRRIERDAEQAAGAGAALLVLPEASMVGFAHDPRPAAEPLDGPWATGVRHLARSHGLLVVVGMFRPAGDGRVHNTVLATDGRDVEAYYDKVHLYDAFGTRESDRTAPGEQFTSFEALGTRIGLATCYDVRFADQFTSLGRAGAEVVCLPTAWADGPRKAEQWRLLVRARAMDAQAFVLGCDQALDDQALDDQAKTSFGVGGSLVAGPLGQVLAEVGTGPELLLAEVDLDQVRQTRAAVPILG